VNDLIWYAIGRKKERRIHERALSVERYTIEQGLRAQYGMPPLPTQAQPGYIAPSPPLVTWRGVRRLALVLAVLAVLLFVLFVAFAVVFGVQHHLIYMAPSR